MAIINIMHFEKLDLNLLVAFCALMSHRHVTRAAHAINVTQPALSHALNRLRDFYKDPLFYHAKGLMQPSARALEIIEPISKALEQIAGTFQSTFNPASLHRTFRIGLVDYPAAFLLPALMLRLRQDAPSAQLNVEHMNCESAERLLSTLELDFAIGVMPITDSSYVRETNTIDRFVVIARQQHPDISKRLTLAKYAKLGHIRIPLYGAIDAALSKRGVSRNFSVAAENVWNVPFLVARSNLLATIPEVFASIFGRVCQLRIFRPPFEISPYKIDLVWHERAQGDQAHAWLRQTIQTTAKDIRGDLIPPVGGEFALEQRLASKQGGDHPRTTSGSPVKPPRGVK